MECQWRFSSHDALVGLTLSLVAFVNSVNIEEGEPSERQMTTGAHTVRDIYCVKCGTVLGWKYVRQISLSFTHLADFHAIRTFLCYSFFRWSTQEHAYEDSQKYKEGKYILERNLLVDVQ